MEAGITSHFPSCEAASSSAILPTHCHRRLPPAVTRPVRPLHASPPHIATAIVDCYCIPPSPCCTNTIACEWKYFSPASHPRWYQHTHDLTLPTPFTSYCLFISAPSPCLRHLHLLVPLGTPLHSHLVLVACEGTSPSFPSCHLPIPIPLLMSTRGRPLV